MPYTSNTPCSSRQLDGVGPRLCKTVAIYSRQHHPPINGVLLYSQSINIGKRHRSGRPASTGSSCTSLSPTMVSYSIQQAEVGAIRRKNQTCTLQIPSAGKIHKVVDTLNISSPFQYMDSGNISCISPGLNSVSESLDRLIGICKCM